MHERKVSLQARGLLFLTARVLKGSGATPVFCASVPTPGSWLPPETLLHVVSLVSAECKSNDWCSVPVLLD